MKSWDSPTLPSLGTGGLVPSIFNSSSGELQPATVSDTAQMYVCGITPYDATHLGHANTYLAYDTLNRALRDAGIRVHYVQNVTDVDDPLLERAKSTGADWSQLAQTQIELFRTDMQALRILPPDEYVGVVETIQDIAEACKQLLESGFAYWVESEDGKADLYFDYRVAEQNSAWKLGEVSGLTPGEMIALFAERGGDPDRLGKRNRLDPLLWRAKRENEPSWSTTIGEGRPGWHIECSVIGAKFLDAPIQLSGGGSDLLFPHQEMSAAHSAALLGKRWSQCYSNAGMLHLDGEKMSKSRGNLVFVSSLLREGIDPRVIRLALLNHHYRSDWEWQQADLDHAKGRLNRWLNWSASRIQETKSTDSNFALVKAMRNAVSNDLDTPSALELVDRRVLSETPASAIELAAINALLGIELD
ncbi:MAG: cysteine--1-D-myo-inosityl 2-amino-2-deoxy-alpha-D-glucopyranoside ligase [Cryobacterium sp.]|nr:cysteine--1-D-myo-inosityl 2-amino-2-deoxy-alpha-D-glucopyranoside ligase [Cryobacterium sp.]